MTGRAPDGGDPVLEELEAALRAGRVRPEQVTAVLRATGGGPARGGVGAQQVLVALGLAVALLGVVLLYARAFPELPAIGKLLTPFVFPLAAGGWLAVAAWRRRPLWEREVATFLTASALSAAWAAAHAGTADVRVEHWGLVGSALVAVLGGGLVLALRPVLRAAALALMVGVVGMAEFGAASLGLDAVDELRWVQFVLAAVLVAVAALMRRRAELAALAATGAVALVCVGGVMSLAGTDTVDQPLTVWHAVLTVTAAAAMVAAAGTGQPVLWFAAVGSTIMWFMFTIPTAGGDPAAGVAVVVAGLLLALLGALAARWRRRRRPAVAGEEEGAQAAARRRSG